MSERPLTILRSVARPIGFALAAASAAVAISGCSMIKTAAVKNVAGMLSQSGDTFRSDDDPELVRRAVPFALKMYESLLVSVPKHEPLLVATCSAYTSYSYAFVETDADVLSEEHHDEVKALRAEAVTLYLRARDYCLRGVEVKYPGLTKALAGDPVAALKRVKNKEDVPLLYWTAAAWGAAMSLRKDPELLIDFPAVRALAERALELDEAWNDGSTHELMISLDSLGEAYGGSEEGARKHFARAVELQHNLMPSPYVALATGISYPKGDRAEFEKLLNQALAIDPQQLKSERLVNLIAQRRAQALLDRLDEMFPK
jgi:predicted anti-sigma-YlaC factor YlaD